MTSAPTTLIAVNPSKIKKGDKFRDTHEVVAPANASGWDALSSAYREGDMIAVKVQYQPDGGIGVRYWDADSLNILTVERANG